MLIPELFTQELAFWTTTNQKLFGVTPIHEEDSFDKIQEGLNKDCEKYWNSDNPCKLAKNLNSGKLNKDASLQEKKSYRLQLNFKNLCIDVYGKYNGTELKICAIPTPCDDLCWIINGSHYVPRVTAVRDTYTFISRDNDDRNIILGEGWKYDKFEKKFTCSITKDAYKFEPTREEIFNNHLSKRSKAFLQALLGDTPLTVHTFETALQKNMPLIKPESIFNYKFARIEYFEDIILNSNKYAQPTKRILLGVNKLVGSTAKQYSTSGEHFEGCLIRCESKIFALENFRTCVNIYNNKNGNSDYQPAFTYYNTNGFFDSFKTATTKTAGRQRMMLDNVIVKDGMLWTVDPDGTQHNMFEYCVNAITPPKRLSCLSEAPFCNNDQPKRIMMNAKMTAQAVTLKDEIDPYTHRIMARVGFTDIEGYTFADSIVISESFAERLRTYSSDILYLTKTSNLYNSITDKDAVFDLEKLKQIYPTKNVAILDGYENFKIDHIDEVNDIYARVFVTWEIPFRLGDKITNLHGAKGTVGLILPDDQMPRLTKKVGHMQPGPLEIIISGFSTMRRVSLGQIFEAWANASDVECCNGEDFIQLAIHKYAKQMKKYSENSIVEFAGETNIIPVGEINIMRLYHHASTKVSCSSADYAYLRTLRFGEQEKLNMVANDCPNILKELGIRSVTKYIGSHKMITDMETQRELPKNPRLSLTFAELLKSMGYNIQVNGRNLTGSDFTIMDKEDEDYKNNMYKGVNQ